MVFARVVSADLLVGFTPGASSIPTTTQALAVITNLYKDAYRIVWGPGTYIVYNALAPDAIIDTEDFSGFLIGCASARVQAWYEAGISSNGQVVGMPSMRFTAEEKHELKTMLNRRTDRLTNIRLWGEEYDDY